MLVRWTDLSRRHPRRRRDRLSDRPPGRRDGGGKPRAADLGPVFGCAGLGAVLGCIRARLEALNQLRRAPAAGRNR